jgi:hypothetical protein
MLQQYISNVFDVSALCCSKCFMLQVVNILSECCICVTHMLQVYIPDVSSVAFKCFMLHIFHVVRRVRGHGE